MLASLAFKGFFGREMNKKKLKPDSKRKGNKKSRSISIDLTISIVVVVVIVFALVVSVSYLTVSRKAKTQLEEKANEYIVNLIDSLELPIWNMDEESVIKIGESYIDNELVAVLRITEPDGSVKFQKVIDDKQDLIKRSGEISHDGQLLGHVEIELTKHLYEESNRQLLKTSILTMWVTVLVLFGGTGLLLRVFLKRPLDDLIKGIDRIAKGDYEYRFHEVKQREIETIISSFDYMAEQVKSREKSLSTINRRKE